jgi:hypothetical protein
MGRTAKSFVSLNVRFSAAPARFGLPTRLPLLVCVGSLNLNTA